MVSMQLAAMVLAVSGTPDVTLLDFQSTHCGPCRAMEPIVAQLVAAGYPVRKVDINREPELAQRYRIQFVPCFVLVSGEREITRITGATSLDQLQALFSQARAASLAGGQERTNLQESDLPMRRIALPRRRSGAPLANLASTAAPSQPTLPQPAPLQPAFGQTPGGGDSTPLTGGAAPFAPDDLLQVCVRLKIEDPTGSSYGSGTIIDARQGEALVLTCGHVFRDSQGKGKIMVDLCGPNGPKGLTGRLVGYDLKRDLGLVSIRPGTAVTTARVASKSYTPARHDRVISTGCDNGGPATAIESRITSIDKFVGPPNFQVAGQPAQGRSGGGLFSADGLLIGVCNCADPTDNEGLFAALPTIHSQLDESGLAMVYEQHASSTPASLAAVSATARTVASTSQPLGNASRAGTGSTSAFDRTLQSAAAEAATLEAVRGRLGDAEVICIVRPLTDPQARSEIITLDHASTEFLRQLSAEKQAQSDRHLTSLELRRGKSARAAAASSSVVRNSQPTRSSSLEPSSREPQLRSGPATVATGLTLPTPLPVLR